MNMHLREASKEDISQIVSVLKASLGEKDLPITEEIWNYKHGNNPFGESLVLVAEDNIGQIIGVRAFMRWAWQQDQKIYYSYRAVDTATHPKFQKKGIFKRLTLKAVEMGIDFGGDFVFNTPNIQSKPGYLKMGWEEAGKITVGLRPVLPLFWRISDKRFQYEVIHKSSTEELRELCLNWNNMLITKGKIFTPKSPEFLKWRYEENPLQNYEVFQNSDFYLAGYVKTKLSFKELRIAECIFTGSKLKSGVIFQKINDWAKKFGAQVISFSPHLFKSHISINGNFGPILTVKKLNLTAVEFQKISKLRNWDYSLGDLELF